MTWTYEEAPFTVLPEGVFGFVYCISYTDGSHYIGKKQCVSEKALPALKDGTVRPDATHRIGRNIEGKRVQFDIVRKETSWRKYIGSSKLTADKTVEYKTVIELAYSKRQLTYLENKYLFAYEAIEDPSFVNENIMSRFFRGNIT
jgi:hypothetical protein